jgi:hypothetical protein
MPFRTWLTVIEGRQLSSCEPRYPHHVGAGLVVELTKAHYGRVPDTEEGKVQREHTQYLVQYTEL